MSSPTLTVKPATNIALLSLLSIAGCASSAHMICELSPDQFQVHEPSSDARATLLTLLDDSQFPVSGRGGDVEEAWFHRTDGGLAVCVFTTKRCGYHEVAQFSPKDGGWTVDDHIAVGICVR